MGGGEIKKLEMEILKELDGPHGFTSRSLSLS